MVIFSKMTDKKIDFVMIGCAESAAVDRIRTRRTMLARSISHSGMFERILIVNCPLCLPRRLLNKLRGKNNIEHMYPLVLKGRFFSLIELEKRLLMLNLTSIFPESKHFWSRLDRKLIRKRVLSILRKLKIGNPVLWIQDPRIVDIAQGIPARYRIFDALDNLLLHPQMKKLYGLIKSGYEWAEDNADLICIATESQRSMFLHEKKIFLLPNGVDEVFLGDSHKAKDIAVFPKPIVGYVGVMQERIDIGLLEYVISELSEFTFVFIGPNLNPGYFRPLCKFRNVHFLGIRALEDIPSYLNSFDVCIIPHKIDDFTNSMDPLKIYEYLSSGRPIVSTCVAGTEKFAEYIYLADNFKEFVAGIRKAVDEKDCTLSQKRKEVAAKNSWTIRSEGLLKQLSYKLEFKS